MSEPTDATSARLLAVGTRVEVRAGFDQSWSTGFVVEEAGADGYRLRRRSDGQVLPAVFAAEAIRRERKGSMWWV